MLTGVAVFLETVNEILCQTFDILLAVAIKERKYGKSNGKISTEIASAFQKHYFKSVSGSGFGGNDTGRTASDNEDINFRTDVELSCGFCDSFHIKNIYGCFVLR